MINKDEHWAGISIVSSFVSQLQSYVDNDYERLNIINAHDARFKDMKTENNTLKYQMKKPASYCKTRTGLLKGPQKSLEL